jgi:hypothetical protein
LFYFILFFERRKKERKKGQNKQNGEKYEKSRKKIAFAP